jgi:hypothetical protein
MESALEERYRTERPLQTILTDRGILTEKVLYEFFRARLGFEAILLSGVSIGTDIYGLIPKPFAEKKRLVPVRLEGEALALAMADPSDSGLVADLSKRLGMSIRPKIAVSSEIDAALQRYPSVHVAGMGRQERSFGYRMARAWLFPTMLVVPLLLLFALIWQSTFPELRNAVSRWVGNKFDFAVQFFVLYSIWCIALWFLNGLAFPAESTTFASEKRSSE